LFWALLALPSLASAQSFGIERPAAGQTVEDVFEVVVTAPKNATVALWVDGEELSQFVVGPEGRATVRLAAPPASRFVLEARQLDGDEVVAKTSIRLASAAANNPGGTESADLAPPPPPPESANSPDAPDAPEPTVTPSGAAPKPEATRARVDPSSDDLPPPPPPPSDNPAPEAEAEPTPSRAVSGFGGEDPSPRTSEPSRRTNSTLSGDAVGPPQPPSGTRFSRIAIQGLAAFFAVPTSWVIGAAAVGLVTNFSGNNVNDRLAITFAVSGITGGAIAVYTAGYYMDGNGSIWAALLGGTIVTGLTMVSFLADADSPDGFGDDAFVAGAIFGSLAGIGGAIAGYELTSDTSADYSDMTGVRDAYITAVPTVDNPGFVVGLGGRF
jgi:hypothetical protein